MFNYLYINHRRPNTTPPYAASKSHVVNQIRCYVTIHAICCETTSNKTRVSPKHKARVNANMRLVYLKITCSSCLAANSFQNQLEFSQNEVSEAQILLKLLSLGLKFSNNGLGVSASLRFYHSPPLYHNMPLCFLINLNITSYAMTETSCTHHTLTAVSKIISIKSCD